MPKTSYHFDVGNSSNGPIGLCARIKAETQEEALAILRDVLPEEIAVTDHDNGQVVYINVYINGDNISTDDIDEEDDDEDLDDDSWDGEDDPDEEEEKEEEERQRGG